MGLFDEVEKEVEKQVKQPGNIKKLANEAEQAAGGKNSKYGKLIEEGANLYGSEEGRKKQQR